VCVCVCVMRFIFSFHFDDPYPVKKIVKELTYNCTYLPSYACVEQTLDCRTIRSRVHMCAGYVTGTRPRREAMPIGCVYLPRDDAPLSFSRTRERRCKLALTHAPSKSRLLFSTVRLAMESRVRVELYTRRKFIWCLERKKIVVSVLVPVYA